MDPRHPELAIARIDELMAQYKRIIRDMQTCNVSSRLAQSERECGLVVQEICLVAPRLHEAMIQVSRTRRAALAHGIVEEKPVMVKLERPLTEEEGKKIVESISTDKPDEPVEKIITLVEAIDLVEDLELVSTNVKNSEDKTSFEIEQTYKPKKKTTRKKKTTKKVDK